MSERGYTAFCMECGGKVVPSPETVNHWRSFNRVHRDRGEPLLSPTEVVVCPACVPRWQTAREVDGRAKNAEWVREKALADYEKLCERGDAPVPKDYFTRETLELHADRIRNAYVSQRGAARKGDL
jgi:hypothetical protein